MARFYAIMLDVWKGINRTECVQTAQWPSGIIRVHTNKTVCTHIFRASLPWMLQSESYRIGSECERTARKHLIKCFIRSYNVPIPSNSTALTTIPIHFHTNNQDKMHALYKWLMSRYKWFFFSLFISVLLAIS